MKAEGDIETGVNIVLKALTAPVRQIAENAGLEGLCHRRTFLKNAEPGGTFSNAATNEWVKYVRRRYR